MVLSALAGIGCGGARPRSDPPWGPAQLSQERRCQRGETKPCTELGQHLVSLGDPDVDLPRGMVLLETACGAGELGACTKLGTLYARGPNNERSPERARELLSGACREQVAAACTGMGDLAWEAGHHGDAALAFKEACRLGDAVGCERLGMIEWNDAFAGSRDRALVAFATACRQGLKSSCHVLGLAKLNEHSERQLGIRILHDNCYDGHAESCLKLAALSAPELTGVPSCEATLPYAERACRSGNVEGCALENACQFGRAPDEALLLSRLERACAKKDPLSCFYWASQEQSRGSARADPRRLYAAYKTACDNDSVGRALACVRLAAMDLEQATGQVASERPIEFMRTACVKGVAEACCRLSAEYLLGKRVPGDESKAQELRKMACDHEFAACCAPANPSGAESLAR